MNHCKIVCLVYLDDNKKALHVLARALGFSDSPHVLYFPILVPTVFFQKNLCHRTTLCDFELETNLTFKSEKKGLKE